MYGLGDRLPAKVSAIPVHCTALWISMSDIYQQQTVMSQVYVNFCLLSIHGQYYRMKYGLISIASNFCCSLMFVDTFM